MNGDLLLDFGKPRLGVLPGVLHAPAGPGGPASLRMRRYTVTSTFGSGRIPVWVGEWHGDDDHERHELLAHRSLDRAYTLDVGSSLLLEERTATVSVVEVPALWDRVDA